MEENSERVWQREEQIHDEGALERGESRKFYKSRSVAEARERYRNWVLTLGRGKDLLEVGCGTGENVLDYAKNGVRVTGIDISGGLVDKARQLLEANTETRGHVQKMNAEQMTFDPASFDVVCGTAIVHHMTDIAAFSNDTYSCLREGGSILYLEPLGHNPFLKLYRWLTPKRRTPDEAPLLNRDLKILVGKYREVRIEYFLLLGLLASFVFHVTKSEKLFLFLDRLLYPIDKFLLSIPSPLQKWSFLAIIRARK
ncbi:MAG TPA: class I SAM-dependent methyltransferase [Candidatus Sumerlaeota bacterium]|nr:class I SAM-dependent methyltransferase [Candidatus Sumerlaeota bacterium]